jgi:glyoxylase-like metal-dependent hydrolase (beta-lactamase superfamily II)
MTQDIPTLRLYEPAPGILAWYDGRIPGHRWSPDPNWVDWGAMSVGVAAYAVIGGNEAVVYDTHVSIPHAERMRADLTARGVTDFTVVLSHRHLDHVAGTAAFADCPVLANTRTAAHMARDRAAIEAATHHGPPAINPLILPTETFDLRRDLTAGDRRMQLLTFDIHSDDGTVIWLPGEGILLAGDTLEDPITFVSEPEHIARHLRDLHRMKALGARAILPNHGDPARIAAGGFGPGLIDATIRYTEWLVALSRDPSRKGDDLESIIGADLARGTIIWDESYKDVHGENVQSVLTAFGRT